MSTPWNKKQGYGLATDPADSTEGQFDTTGFLADFKWLPGFRQEYSLGSTSKSDALKLYLSEYRLVLSDFISATNHY